MKTTISTFRITLLITLLSLFGTSVKASNSNTIKGDLTHIKIGINGMACPFCAFGLEKKVKKIKGSKNFFVDINKGYITFSVPTNATPPEEELRKMVKEAGFEVRKIEFSETEFTVEKE